MEQYLVKPRTKISSGEFNPNDKNHFVSGKQEGKPHLVEQKERFQDRLDDPNKQWKFLKGDLSDRKLWPEYIQAIQELLSKTSTPHAPWFIIPSNRKWYRNLIISFILIETLKNLKMLYPEPVDDLKGIIIE